MNRRSFLSDMLKAGVACTFLPGAGRLWEPTYERIEVVESSLNLNELFQLVYEIKRKRELAGPRNEIIIARYLLPKIDAAPRHISHFSWETEGAFCEIKTRA